jgi:hypothetical protein
VELLHGSRLTRLVRRDVADLLDVADPLSADVANVVSAIAALRGSVTDALIDAVLGVDQPALLCSELGDVLAINDAAVRHNIAARNAHHITDVLVDGALLWTALLDINEDTIHTVPTTSAVLCSWRVCVRAADAPNSSLVLLLVERFGADAELVRHHVSRSKKKLRKPRTSLSSSTSATEPSTSAVVQLAPPPPPTDAVGSLARNRRQSDLTTSDDDDDGDDDDDDDVNNYGNGELLYLDNGSTDIDDVTQRLKNGSDSPGSLKSESSFDDPTAAASSESLRTRNVGSHSDRPLRSALPHVVSRQSSLPSLTSSGWLTRLRRGGVLSRNADSAGVSTAVTIDFARDTIELRHVLATGVNSTVLRVTVGGRFECAMKTISTRYMSSEEHAELRATTLLAAALQHEHIVRLIGYNLSDSDQVLEFWELCDGTLREHLLLRAGQPPLEAMVVIDYATQVALALRHVHAKAVMHRDIKSSNVLVKSVLPDVSSTSSPRLVLKLADFGEAIAIKPDAQYRTNVGTPEFMAPEVLSLTGKRHERTRAYTELCDVWSFGMLLYELLHDGALPFADVDRFALPARIAGGHVPVLHPDCDASLGALFSDCTRLLVWERPTAAQLCARLEACNKL